MLIDLHSLQWIYLLLLRLLALWMSCFFWSASARCKNVRRRGAQSVYTVGNFINNHHRAWRSARKQDYEYAKHASRSLTSFARCCSSSCCRDETQSFWYPIDIKCCMSTGWESLLTETASNSIHNRPLFTFWYRIASCYIKSRFCGALLYLCCKRRVKHACSVAEFFFFVSIEMGCRNCYVSIMK